LNINAVSTKNMTTLPLRKSAVWSPSRPVSFVIPLALVLFAFWSAAKAFGVSPPPDGGYPDENTAEGDGALFSLNTGSAANTALGFHALYQNTMGAANTALGHNALYSNTTGFYNLANGIVALYSNTTGHDNTATGGQALYFNTTGDRNTAIGGGALTGSDTTGTTGTDNIALGYQAGKNLSSGNNNIDIGNPGRAGEANTIRIGTRETQSATFIAGISGTPVPGVPVAVNSDGQLGVAVSSQRFKDQIKPMDKASEAILALQPVTFRYKHELDPKGTPQFGLVAEEVAQVDPDLVVRDAQGEPYTVRYEAVNAMLLNEFLKEHRQVEEQASKLSEQDRKLQEQETAIAKQQKQIEALTAGLQKVSAQVEMNLPAPQMVLNNQ
jgi:hypothetical protein